MANKPLPQLSDEQMVRRAFPKATAIEWRGPHGLDNKVYFIYPNGLIFRAISRGWSTESEAWADASSRLKINESSVAPEGEEEK